MMSMLGSFTQFERDIIRERTKLGLALARANGKQGGGKHKLSEARRNQVIAQIVAGEKTQTEVARDERISKPSVSRMIKKFYENEQKKLGLDVKLT